MNIGERVSEMAREIALNIECKVNSLVADVIKVSDERAADKVEQAIRGALSGLRGEAGLESTTNDESKDANASEEESKQTRVPKGTVEPFVDRVLKGLSPEGIEPKDVLDFAESDNEKLVKEQSVVTCLRRGNGKKYRKSGKLWFWDGEVGERGDEKLHHRPGNADLRNSSSLRPPYNQEGFADALAS